MSVDLLNATDDAEALSYLLREPVCFPPGREMVRGTDGRFHSNDGHASTYPEWDWYWCLPDSERKRLRKWFQDGGLTPDQYAHIFDPAGDIESAMSDWVLATRLTDQARNVTQPTDRMQSVFDTLRLVREQSDLTDDEWQWLCETVTARADGTYRHRDVIPPAPTTTDLSSMSAWMTQHQIADLLGVKRGTLRQWYNRGKLMDPDEMVNGRPVWSRRTVKQFCEGLQLLNRAGG